MRKSHINGYEFELFKQYDGLVHGIFTRSGGKSLPPFDSLNVSMNSGDDHSAVDDNRNRIAEKMGVGSLFFLNQVHGDKIKVLSKEDHDRSENSGFSKETVTADGIITDIKDLALVIQVADCQAIMLYDAKKKVIANVHSGWRGSIKNIVGKCLDKMMMQFGCEPKNILAGISPSLGPCCAEFVNFKDEIPEHLRQYKIDETVNFNFWKMTMDQLMDKGLGKKNIECFNICTKCNTDTFYSFRAQKKTGRFACVISLI